MRVKYLCELEDEGARRSVPKIEAQELGIRLASVTVGLQLAFASDPEPADHHYLRVQLGKIIHRLAGGHHRSFLTPDRKYVHELNRYGDSMGREVVEIGKRFLEHDHITSRHAGELRERAAKCIPVSPIQSWSNSRRKRHARIKQPVKNIAGLRGHDRLRPVASPVASKPKRKKTR